MQSHTNIDDDLLRSWTLVPFVIALIMLTILVGYSYYWNTGNVQDGTFELAAAEATSIWNKDASFRKWATGHGGVDINSDEREPVSEAMKLTQMNPAYMLRQRAKEFEETYGVKVKITGKRVLNPTNEPDVWQLKALNVFESGSADQIFERQTINSEPYLRYMKAIYMTEGCVQCHGVLGFKDGDLRGGVSISVPLMPYLLAAKNTIRSIATSHLIVWILGFMTLVVAVHFLRKYLDQLNRPIAAPRSSEDKFRRLMSTAVDSMVIVNSVGEMETVSEQLEKMTGYSAVELIGEKIEMLIPVRFGQHERLRNGYLVEPKTLLMSDRRDLCCLHKDGKEIPVEISLGPLETDEGTFVSVVIRDVTKLRQAEEDRFNLQARVAQSQRLEAIGQLARGIAQDFNNHLTAINGYSELILDSLQPDDPSYQHLTDIHHAGECAAELTGQLLAFSRRQILVPEIVDLGNIVGEMETTLRRLIGEDIDLQLLIDKDLRKLNVDPGQIEQVMMDLVLNARDAMPRGGKITVSCTNKELEERLDNALGDLSGGDYVMLSVSDTGEGMGSDTLSHIFEPFYTTMGTDKGAGLGLSTVFGIVKQSGGGIDVESEPDNGTTFRIYFPVADEADVLADHERRGTGNGENEQDRGSIEGNETIMIVDDEVVILDLLERTLERLGYTVLVAHHGKEALQIALQHDGEIDLLVTDVIMPEMGGHELVELIMPHCPNMSVVYMSGYNADMVWDFGPVDVKKQFLQKPFLSKDVAWKIRKTLDERVAIA